MSKSDQAMNERDRRQGAPEAGLAGVAAEVKSLLSALAGEIETSQRRYNDALSRIEARIAAIESSERPSAGAAHGAAGNGKGAPPPGGSKAGNPEPWDWNSAEALAQSYEGQDPGFFLNTPEPNGPEAGEGLYLPTSRHADMTARITSSLAEMRSQNLLTAFETRFSQFEDRIVAKVDGAASRLDGEALRTIERHIREITSRIEPPRAQTVRLESIEAELRAVGDKLSEERLGSILARGGHTGSDLETVARAATEAVATRYADLGGTLSAQTGHIGELKALLETSIEVQRRSDAQAANVLAGLGEVVGAQTDHFAEIRSLLETSISERRESEEQSVATLDTLQQALVQILDRMDAMEAGRPGAPHQASAPAAQSAHIPAAHIPAAHIPAAHASAGYAPAVHPNMPGAAPSPSAAPPPLAEPPETAAPEADPAAVAAPPPAASTDVPAQFITPPLPPPPIPESVTAEYVADALAASAPASASAHPTASDAPPAYGRSPVDFVADAQRARIKASAHRTAERDFGATRPLRNQAGSSAAGRAGLMQGIPARLVDAALARAAAGSAPPRKVPSRLIAGALATVVLINGALLYLVRSGNETSSPIETGSLSRDAGPIGGAAVLDDGEVRGDPVPLGESGKRPGTLRDAQAAAERASDAGPPADGRARLPLGITMQQPRGEPPGDAVVKIYEQQVMAGLSGTLGVAAANTNPAELATERAISVGVPSGAEPNSDKTSLVPLGLALQDIGARPSIEDATRLHEKQAMTGAPADAAASNMTYAALAANEADAEAGRTTQLELPPATVGPLSLRLAAANGDASAQFEVGSRLAEGKGTDQSFKQAIQWYQRSAAQGFAQAQYRLGSLYERGLGLAKDIVRAREWYQRAAEQGNVKAMHNLAVLSAGDDGGAPDYAAAAQWFSRAAEYGLADSQFNLAVLYENGLGVSQNRLLAYKWYVLAALGGDKDSATRRDQLKAELSAADLAVAEDLIKGFQQKAMAPLINDARIAGQDWQKRQSAAGTDDANANANAQ